MRDADADGVPISFGYDGEAIFRPLLKFVDGGTKFDFRETTETTDPTTHTPEPKVPV